MDFDLANIRFPEPPKRDVKFLGPGDPTAMNARLHFSHDMWSVYAEGYQIAADRLVESTERIPTDLNFVVYPILFLYRHHLELRLKEILGLLHELGFRKTLAPKIHCLDTLWSECGPGIEKSLGSGDREWFTSITYCIKQLSAIDSGAEDFRYSKKKDGSKSMESLTHVNLKVLKETMYDICGWLYGVSCVLTEYRIERRNGA